MHSLLFMLKAKLPSRLAEEPHYRSHLRSGERLGVLLVALGTHRLPHAAREVHLFAKVPQALS